MKTISLADIDHNMGHNGNMSGIVPQLIYGYHEDVGVWPTEPEPVADTAIAIAAAGALVGDLTMKSGTKAYKLDLTEDEGEFKMAPVGETDGGHWEYDLSIVKAKIAKTILGFMNAAQSRKMFFIVTDENETMYLMGSKRRGATFVNGGDGSTTGKNGSDRNQTTLNFKFRCAKALIYEGDIDSILTEV